MLLSLRLPAGIAHVSGLGQAFVQRTLQEGLPPSRLANLRPKGLVAGVV